MKKIIVTQDIEIANLFQDRYPVWNDHRLIPEEKGAVILLLSYSSIIPSEALEQNIYCNVHNSLLPKYRGRHAFTWALIHGEKEVGYTLHRVDAGIDTGPIIEQITIPVFPDENINQLFQRVRPILYPWLFKIIEGLNEEKIRNARPQLRTGSGYYRKRTREDGRINWNQDVKQVYDFIRAQVPPYAPGAFTFRQDQEIIICDAAMYYTGKDLDEPGKLLNQDEAGLHIQCRKGVLIIKKILNNGEELPAANWRISAGVLK